MDKFIDFELNQYVTFVVIGSWQDILGSNSLNNLKITMDP